MLSALQRTHNAAQAILKKVAPHVSTPTPNLGASQVTTLPPLALPFAQPLTAQLVSKGVTDSVAERVSSALSRVVRRLKETFEGDYHRRGGLAQTQTHFAQDPKLPSLLHSAYLTLYAKTVRDWTTYILHGTSRRRPFNQNAVPLLEQAFSKNAFPSRLDKVELASLCEMDYRQVHVWFQNRRSRCRKEGRDLARRSRSPLLVELESSVDALLDDLDDDDDSGEASQISGCSNPSTSIGTFMPIPVPGFHLEAPDHAFPHPYPPQCPYDPFPMGPKAPAFQLPWLRIPSSPVNGLKMTPPDVASLTTTFSKLTLCDEQAETVSPCASSAVSVPPGQGLGSYLGFVTPCAPAPHPALARRGGRIPRAPCVSTSVAPNGVRIAHSERSTRSCPRRSQKRSSTPSTEVPPCKPLPVLGSHSTKRTLPRRVPKHPPVRRETPNSSPYSTTSRLVSTSSSSLSSTSSTSTDSDIDSPLATPPLLPNLLNGSVEQLVPPFILNHSGEWGDLSYFDNVAALSNETLFSKSSRWPNQLF
ncbi:hypothetical protein LXA43DRAFT_366308 [Ganoderma leucocontextum]|nr:hypothetical protein LXA43DRAFT_366308 [Ganoderma leucocontextum]